MEGSTSRNLQLILRDSLSRLGLLTSAMEDGPASEWGGRLQVKARDVDATGSMLSGGNQQKVVIAKWLSTRPKILIIDEPTRGIDVGTKSEVHRLLDVIACDGMAVLMISSELPEVLAMSDRVYVMYEGEVAAEFSRDEYARDAAASEKVLAAMTGAGKKVTK